MTKKEEVKMWKLIYELLKGGYSDCKKESYYHALTTLYKWSRSKLKEEKSVNTEKVIRTMEEYRGAIKVVKPFEIIYVTDEVYQQFLNPPKRIKNARL